MRSSLKERKTWWWKQAPNTTKLKSFRAIKFQSLTSLTQNWIGLAEFFDLNKRFLNGFAKTLRVVPTKCILNALWRVHPGAIKLCGRWEWFTLKSCGWKSTKGPSSLNVCRWNVCKGVTASGCKCLDEISTVRWHFGQFAAGKARILGNYFFFLEINHCLVGFLFVCLWLGMFAFLAKSRNFLWKIRFFRLVPFPNSYRSYFATDTLFKSYVGHLMSTRIENLGHFEECLAIFCNFFFKYKHPTPCTQPSTRTFH